MPLGKRKYITGRGRVVRGRVVPASYANRAKRARITGRTGYANIVRVGAQVRRLNKMIETKMGTFTSPNNVALPHNNTYIVQSLAGGDLNPLATTNGNQDPMNIIGQRIGDNITLKGLMIRGFVENALERSKVYYRIMLLKLPRGFAPNRAGIYRNNCANKMIDQINTESVTVVWQKIFICQTANQAPTTVGLTGVPTAATPAGIGTRTFSAWIPGNKFVRNGHVNYENNSQQVKFFDFKLVIVCYDWNGTPQDVNNVGRLNELYTKMYFQDV